MAKLLFRRISLVLVIGVIVADAVDLAGYEFSDDPTDESTSDKKDSGESGSSSNSGSGFGSGYGFGSGNSGHGGSSSAVSGPGYGSGSGYGYGSGSNGAAGYGYGYGSGSGGGMKPTPKGNRKLVGAQSHERQETKPASLHRNAERENKNNPFFGSAFGKANRRIPHGFAEANPSISNDKRTEMQGSASHIITSSATGSGT
ncbi:hypothetical protein O6H91_21G055900 [Diphasiastrum complanatum]|uniref:Uncharacterized protein n=2 Tax=Diphasiastrum complanatum TaxID=34168 RepID=A0ACC2AL23_DIPCM|nr:hypothetical protein O6H91_21G055900 [Diphasiastrum complanatum]